MLCMKLGFFTDCHYSSAELTCGRRRCNQSLRKIEEAMNYFSDEACDLVLCLGDLLDKEKTLEEEADNLKAVALLLDRYSVPMMFVMGNHDGFSFQKDEFYEILGKDRRPKNMEADGKTLLFLDACYYTDGVAYCHDRPDWKNSFYPNLAELKDLLQKATGDVYVFLHQNLEPQAEVNHRVKNGDEVIRILEESGKVKKVFQGHFHPGNKVEHNGIEYVTFPAMCENENCFYTIEI